MRKNETIAAIATVLIAVLIVVMLGAGGLSFDPTTLRQPPRPMAELVEIDEEFIDFFDEPVPAGAPSKAYAPQPQQHASEAAEAGGSDLADAGAAAAPSPDVVSERPSPLPKPRKEKPEKTGPSKEQLEAEARRKARKGISDAFKAKENAADNTTAHGDGKGDTGSPDGGTSTVDGSGTGSVGGGWIMPAFAKVKTGLTGRIELRAVIDSEGKVVKIEQTGGKAPAGADAALVARCIAEVRRHKFTRTDNDAPPSATARIVYTFR